MAPNTLRQLVHLRIKAVIDMSCESLATGFCEIPRTRFAPKMIPLKLPLLTFGGDDGGRISCEHWDSQPSMEQADALE